MKMEKKMTMRKKVTKWLRKRRNRKKCSPYSELTDEEDKSMQKSLLNEDTADAPAPDKAVTLNEIKFESFEEFHNHPQVLDDLQEGKSLQRDTKEDTAQASAPDEAMTPNEIKLDFSLQEKEDRYNRDSSLVADDGFDGIISELTRASYYLTSDEGTYNKTQSSMSFPTTKNDAISWCEARKIKDKLMNNSTTWRRHGEARRKLLLQQDTFLNSQMSIVMKTYCLERCFDISDKILERFQSMCKSGTNLDDAFFIGNRLQVFLSDVLPKHPSYKTNMPHIAKLRKESIQRIDWVNARLTSIALQIDEEQLNDFILCCGKDTDSLLESAGSHRGTLIGTSNLTIFILVAVFLLIWYLADPNPTVTGGRHAGGESLETCLRVIDYICCTAAFFWALNKLQPFFQKQARGASLSLTDLDNYGLPCERAAYNKSGTNRKQLVAKAQAYRTMSILGGAGIIRYLVDPAAVRNAVGEASSAGCTAMMIHILCTMFIFCALVKVQGFIKEQHRRHQFFLAVGLVRIKNDAILQTYRCVGGQLS